MRVLWGEQASGCPGSPGPALRSWSWRPCRRGRRPPLSMAAYSPADAVCPDGGARLSLPCLAVGCCRLPDGRKGRRRLPACGLRGIVSDKGGWEHPGQTPGRGSPCLGENITEKSSGCLECSCLEPGRCHRTAEGPCEKDQIFYQKGIVRLPSFPKKTSTGLAGRKRAGCPSRKPAVSLKRPGMCPGSHAVNSRRRPEARQEPELVTQPEVCLRRQGEYAMTTQLSSASRLHPVSALSLRRALCRRPASRGAGFPCPHGPARERCRARLGSRCRRVPCSRDHGLRLLARPLP